MKKRQYDWIISHWAIVLFLVFFGGLVSYLIIAKPSPFFDWDEAIYAQVGREMMRQKSFLVPLWQGMPWLDKPPIPSLLYGVVQLLPVAPEISTRLLTLALSITALALLYRLTLRLSKQKTVALMTVVITAFVPGFFQRSQVLNVDVFLLIGWLGYVIWYEQFWVSTLFLLLAVLSKSLLGYYPPLLFFSYHSFELLTKQVDRKKYIQSVKRIFVQIFMASLWFIVMTVAYGYPFIQYQFIDSHFKRVASSIEQHFGQRTFYIDILIEQFKWLVATATATIGYFVYRFFRSSKTDKRTIFLILFFVPWFLFLNLTKTKIAWYIYPVIPQFAFLSVYPIAILKKNQLLIASGCILMLTAFFSVIVPIKSIVSGTFSSLGDHQLIAQSAKNANCKILYVLVDDTTRTSYATLKQMDLVISTTTWWGNHPSVAYYADARTTYFYTVKDMTDQMGKSRSGDCFITTKEDYASISNNKTLNILKKNPTYVLLRK